VDLVDIVDIVDIVDKHQFPVRSVEPSAPVLQIEKTFALSREIKNLWIAPTASKPPKNLR
jgi:hypothetical protein